MVTLRLRSMVWFVAGAMLATAVTAAVTAPDRVLALPGASESTVVMVEPTRVLDTRFNVGLGVFAANVSLTLQVTGEVATIDETKPAAEQKQNKTVVPDGATGVLLNITGVAPTGGGFVSVRPGDATGTPSTSNLNVSPGQVVPNAVTVAVPTTGAFAGQIDIFYGSAPGNTVNIIVDIVGYTTNTGLADLTNRVIKLETDGGAGTDTDLTELTNRLAAAEDRIGAAEHVIGLNAKITSALDATLPFSVTSERADGSDNLNSTPRAVRSVSVRAPVAGHVTLISTAAVSHQTDGGSVRCAILKTASIPASDISRKTPSFQIFVASQPSRNGQLAATRTFSIAGGTTVSYSLACEESVGLGLISARTLTAIFTPAP